MKRHVLFISAILFSFSAMSQWTEICTDPSGDSAGDGIDAVSLEFQYDAELDQLSFRYTLTNLSSFSTGPAADFSFFLPNGLESGNPAGLHWTSSTPVHKSAFIYCAPGGSAPNSYSYPAEWPNHITEAQNIPGPTPYPALCSDCIDINVDVAMNQITYTMDRTAVISDAELNGQSTVTIGIVANVGHNVGWNDAVTHTDQQGSDKEFTFTVGGVNSIDKVEDNVQLSVYPNPATREINFSNSQNATTAVITDLTGKRVREVARLNRMNQVEVADLTEGWYILSLYKEGTLVSTARFVKN